MNSLTANIHLLFASFYRPNAKRHKIICESKAFPSDQYALDSQVRWHGLDPAHSIIELDADENSSSISTERVIEAIRKAGDELALVFIGGVNYYSGQVFDMKRITEAAHTVGAYAGFDLAHAVGNIQMQLHHWDVDFACWCSYKYLNSGPGGVGGVFIHLKHAHNRQLPRLAGWWGTKKGDRFQMLPQFDPIPTAEGWQLSNAPVLSMAAHYEALKIFDEVGMESLVAKSKNMTTYVLTLLDEINKEKEKVRLLTPREARGCQLSLFIPQNGKAVFEALMNEGVVVDWREPGVIRIAPVPLYNSFEDCFRFIQILSNTLN